ncbi:MAG TPA: class I SAM-dependent methyltransferase, partial [Verrucomicrobiae bacterium]
NTHAPSPFAGEGIYDWLKHREPRWSSLAIVHRLDKETSGVMVFGKTTTANRSLTEQFAQRRAQKKYLLLTDRRVPTKKMAVRTAIARVGEKYASRPGGEPAETDFISRGDYPAAASLNESTSAATVNYQLVEACPRTGRTHQIRVHAAENGFPILGDTLYGGTPAARVFLHATEISLVHPATGKAVVFSAPAEFQGNARLQLRAASIEPEATNAFRLLHGASDGWPGWVVEKFGDFLLSQSEEPLTGPQRAKLEQLANLYRTHGTYHKILSRQVRGTTAAEASPQLVLGHPAPERFEMLENGIRYEMSFAEGYSVGLFLDQRDNRRRFLTGHVAADFPEMSLRNARVLNCFAYTCGFSVCAASAGAHATSLDLSKKYLDWGRRNFAVNGLNPAEHDFIFGDTFDWLRRFARKNRAFELIVLDPPTFSQSKEGIFRAEKDYRKLVTAALPVLKPDGILFASTNAANLLPEKFLAEVQSAVEASGRSIAERHYFPQPPDFPVARGMLPYLKTAWFRVSK